MEKKENVIEWLKEELNLEEIQVVVPPTDREIRRAIKSLMKVEGMKGLFRKILDITDKQKNKIEYLQKLRFMLECDNCNQITTQEFDDYCDSESYKLRCKICGHIGYIL